MKTKLLFFTLLVTGATLPAFSQVLNDFETGSPEVIATYGAEFSTIANPDPNGNTTATAGQVGRTSANWYELIRFSAVFSVPANETKYLHMLARYTSSNIPNMSVRVDAVGGNDGSVDIHPLNTYNTPGDWMDMVFKIEGGDAGVNATEILFFADASVNVLNNTDSFAQIDEFVLNDSDTPANYVPQDMVLNDFEEGAPETTASYGAEFAIIDNPLMAGNASEHVGEIKRTSGNWYELIRFAKYFNVPANTTRYIHALMRYTSATVPNISLRIDGSATSDGNTDIHPTVDYTSVGQWQDMVFEIPGGETGKSVTHLLFFADASVGVLNDTDSFAYIDQILINGNNEPAATTPTFKQNAFTVFPNPTNGIWNFKSAHDAGATIQISDISGKTVLSTDKNYIDASDLATGVYFAKITSGKEIQVIKVVKN